LTIDGIITLAGNLSGSGPLTDNGGFSTDVQLISGANTPYTGTVTYLNGTLTVGSNNALGTGPLIFAELFPGLGSSLTSNGSYSIANNFTVNGSEGDIGGNHNLTFTGTGNLVNSGGKLAVANSATTTFAGSIVGAGGVTQAAGTVLLSAVNGYAGPTMITTGTLRLAVDNALPSASALTVAGPGIFDLNNKNVTIGSLAGSGSVTLGTGNLSTGADNTSTSFSGSIAGTGGLTKIGTGTLTLSGANTYMGATAINGGVLRVGANNVLPSGAIITVAAGATLDLNSNNLSLGSLAGSGNVILGSGTLTVGGNNAATTAIR
jgi:autotransporter-associated beta strand protein